jgi:TonB-dependent SusC/RagA subfamily outer membrane receptor
MKSTMLKLPFLVVLTLSLAFSQTTDISGTVTDATNGKPLAGASVSLDGTDFGTASTADGTYSFEVPISGETGSLTVRYIGYSTQTVNIDLSGNVTQNFALKEDALQMDQIVVTGTVGETDLKKVGSSMTSIDIGSLTEKVPVNSFGTALQARIPGVRSVGTAGGVGSARSLQIRGTNSFSLEQRPVIYVDGIRVDANKNDWGWMAGNACCFFSGGAGEDRLNDISPDEIERIEVLKGAAAATMYGAEASNGVIQIFTKRGRLNTKPSFKVNMSTGFNRHRENLPTTLKPKFKGTDGTVALDPNKTLIENGLIRKVDLTAQGGGEDVTYFFGAGNSFEEGSIKPNEATRANLRLNLRWIPSDKWQVGVNTAFAKNTLNPVQSGNNWMSLWGNSVMGNPLTATKDKPYGEPWVAVKDIVEVWTQDDANRWTGSFNFLYTPTTNFSNKVTFGADIVDEEKARVQPYGRYYTYTGTTGEKTLGYRRSQKFNFEYVGSYKFNFAGIGNDLSWGTQTFWDESTRQMGTAKTYAGPGVTTLSGGAETFSGEYFSETINMGFFFQNRFEIADKLFTSVGLRVDGNSAFGENFGFKQFPKFDLAYLISEEGFMPSAISTLKLRVAWGMAGKFPGAYDQFLTFTPTAVLGNVAGVTPDNPGNADLKPETTTETEFGFDLGLLDNKVGVNFTVYNNVTSDALLPLTLPPSAGFASSQLSNIGEIKNSGYELTLNATLINTQNLRWNLSFNYDGNKNEITELGTEGSWQKIYANGADGADSVYIVGGHRLGYPVQGNWSRVITEWDAANKTHKRSDYLKYMGPPLPLNNMSVGNTLTFGRFRLYALISSESGAIFPNSDRPYKIRQGGADEILETYDFKNLDSDGNPSRTAATDSTLNYWSLVSAYDKRDNIRLREVSVTYSVPESWTSKIGLGPTDIIFSGQNVWWWDDCNCEDPNKQYTQGAYYGNNLYGGQSGFLAMPQARTFLLTIKTGL